MNNSEKIIGGVLAAAGIAAFLLCTKDGKKIGKKIKKESRKMAENAEDGFQKKRKVFKDSIADKVFDFAVEHRQTLANATSIVLPFLLKNMVKKKL